MKIVTLAQAGDTEAFSMLCKHYYGKIYGFLKKQTNDDEAARDLTNDVFFKAYIGLEKTNGAIKTQFKSWLFQIAVNVAKDFFRDKKRLPCVSLESLDGDNKEEIFRASATLHPIDYCSEERPEDFVGEWELIEKALEHVSPRYRECFYLYTVEDLSSHQIAIRLSISESCVRGYVSHGRQQFYEAHKRLSEK